MRLRVLLTTLLLLPLAGLLLNAQSPSAATSAAKKEYLERRAAILRQMAETKAKLSALELDLQLLEESRSAEPAAPPPASWREEPSAPDGVTKKTSVRCLSVTRDGKRCTRPAEAGTKYCWQHKNH